MLTALALLLTGCGSGGSGGEGTVRLVASTDVWGSVAKAVAGDRAGAGVSITSIIDDPAADPHTYEASTRTQLAVSRADVIVENGGGYDDFLTRMRSSAKSATVLDAVRISGFEASSGDELNEHVWYDFPTVAKVADRIAAALTEKDPDHAEDYRRNAAAFKTRLTGLEQTEAQVKAAAGGTGVAITEPVPLYLLQACGLVDRTPEAFSAAVEEDTDVSPAVLRQTLALFTDRSVKALVYNEQTSGPQTRQVLDAAKAAGIAVVPVTETLPKGEDYLGWMRANLAAVQSAVG